MTEQQSDLEARVTRADRRLGKLQERYTEKRPKDAEKIGKIRARLVGEEPDADDDEE